MAGDHHFQLCSQRPRPTPHFSMRDSSCSCRDAIWEEGVIRYSKAHLGLRAAPALLCSCTSSIHTSGCSVCALPGAVLGLLWDRIGTAHRDLRVRTSCLGFWLEQSCPGRKSATTLQPLPSLYMGASRFVCYILPQAAILAALDC